MLCRLLIGEIGKMPTEKELFDKGRIVCQQFAKEGHPKWGIAYQKYVVIKYQSKLFVLEYAPNTQRDGLDLTIKEVDY